MIGALSPAQSEVLAKLSTISDVEEGSNVEENTAGAAAAASQGNGGEKSNGSQISPRVVIRDDDTIISTGSLSTARDDYQQQEKEKASIASPASSLEQRRQQQQQQQIEQQQQEQKDEEQQKKESCFAPIFRLVLGVGILARSPSSNSQLTTCDDSYNDEDENISDASVNANNRSVVMRLMRICAIVSILWIIIVLMDVTTWIMFLDPRVPINRSLIISLSVMIRLVGLLDALALGDDVLACGSKDGQQQQSRLARPMLHYLTSVSWASKVGR